MVNITEIIPDDLPEWAIDAMAEGRVFTVMMDRIKKLETSGLPKQCPSCGGMGCGSPCEYGENEYDAMVGEQQERYIETMAELTVETYMTALPAHNEICDKAIRIAMLYAFKKGVST